MNDSQPAPEPELDDFGDGWCLDCGEPFHLDDTGGYNPPCNCGKCVGLCRSCCDADQMPDDDDERPEESYPDDSAAPSQRDKAT